MSTECHSLCCTDMECPCSKICDETCCQFHMQEEAKYWRSYFGIKSGMTKQEIINQLEAFRPTGRDDEA